MTIFAGIAEFERALIRERTGAGREVAKQRGVRFGRPRKLNTDQAQVATQLLAEGKPVRDSARTVQCTRSHDLSLGCCFVTEPQTPFCFQPTEHLLSSNEDGQ